MDLSVVAVVRKGARVGADWGQMGKGLKVNRIKGGQKTSSFPKLLPKKPVTPPLTVDQPDGLAAKPHGLVADLTG